MHAQKHTHAAVNDSDVLTQHVGRVIFKKCSRYNHNE